MTAPTLHGSWARIRAVNVIQSDTSLFDPNEHLRTSRPGTPFSGAFHADAKVQIAIGRNRGRTLWAVGTDRHSPDSLFPSCELEQVEVAKLGSFLGEMVWTSASLGIHDKQEPIESVVADLEQLLMAANGSLAWVLEATPTDPADTETTRALERLVSVGDRGGYRARQGADRAQRILDHLDLRSGSGLWSARLHCGAADASKAMALLGTLMETSGLRSLDIAVSAGGGDCPVVTSDCLGALVRPPAIELPGIRLRRRAHWDVTPESKGPVRLGKVLDSEERSGPPLAVSLSTINRHVFVSGATGSGKSETVRRLLEELTRNAVPWLVIEPAKAEYHHMAGNVHPADVVVIRLGSGAQAVSLNPLEPSSILRNGERSSFSLATHIAMVRELFAASFDMEDPFPQILAAALDRSYETLGWDTATGTRIGIKGVQPIYPTLSDLRRHALDVVDQLGYGEEISDNVRAAVDVRINSLRHGAAGRFFENGHPLDLEALANLNVVLQIEDLGNERDQAFLMGAVLIRWSEMLRLWGDSGGTLRHVLAIEEAHRLLRATEDSRASAIEQFANLLAEVRSYGQGVIVAEQIPSKLITDVIKNSALKVMHRLPAADDRETVGATMNLRNTQSEVVVSFPPGRAAVHTDGMDYPVMVAMPSPPSSVQQRRAVAAPTMTRSPSCSDDCAQGNRCSNTELALASRLANDDAFRIWVDLCVLARGIGEPPVGLAPVHIHRWKRMAPKRRQLRCALGLAADISVGSRMPDMLAFYDPGEFSHAIADELHETVGTTQIPAIDTRWQIAEFRWIDLVRQLAHRAASDASAPGLTSAELDDRGLKVSGVSAAEHLESIRSHHERLQTEFLPKAFGRPSTIESIVRSSRTDGAASLFRSLGVSEAWPTDYLDNQAVKER